MGLIGLYLGNMDGDGDLLLPEFPAVSNAVYTPIYRTPVSIAVLFGPLNLAIRIGTWPSDRRIDRG